MMERWTDRARKVMVLANQEACRFNHEFIGTEHVLLGIVKEGSGVAAKALKNLDIDLRRVRLTVEKMVESGPDMVIMGKIPHTGELKRALERITDESKSLGANYIGTEHLLLTLITNPNTIASQALLNLGTDYNQVKKAIVELLEAAETPIQKMFHSGVSLIAQERERQIKNEGWSANHDDRHTKQELAFAAACYAMPMDSSIRYVVPKFWPWEDKWWKPSTDNRIKELVKAGALIAAEIDRLQRVKDQ